MKGQLYLPAIKLYRILGLDPEKLTYSKKPESQEKPDEIDLQVNQCDNDLINPQGSTNPPRTETLIQGLHHEEIEEIPSQINKTPRYQNIMDELISEVPQSAEEIPDDKEFVDIQLDSANDAPWDGLFEPCHTSSSNDENEGDKSQYAQSNSAESDTGKKQVTNSVFENKYEDISNTNPYMV